MPSDATTRAIELERTILRGLCHSFPRDAAFTATIQSLHGHRWQYDEHRVVFEALDRVRPADPAPLREQLAAHATRMGFPEVGWELYFAQPQNAAVHAGDAGTLESSLSELKALVQT